MRCILVLLLSFFFVGKCLAQPKAKATVDSTRLLIGDQMPLHVDVVVQSGAELMLFDLESLSKSPVEFVRQTDWDTISEGQNLRLRKDLMFTVWDSGYHVVPPVPVVVLQNGVRDTAFTRDIPVEVLTLNTPELADIKPIIEEPETWKDYLPMLIPLAVLLLAGLAIFIGLRMKTEQEALPPPPPPRKLPPHELAIRDLAFLRDEKLWEQGQVKAYHSRLTHIVREYLENRYGIQALEQTTDEILAQMRKAKLSDTLTEKMTALLQTADLVKFAKAEPPADYHERAMVMAVQFIEETKKINEELKMEN